MPSPRCSFLSGLSSPIFAAMNDAVEWLKTLGVAGFMFFLLRASHGLWCFG